MPSLITQSVSEKEFQAAVIQAAALLGWMVYHTYDSRRCVPGFPDLLFCKKQQGVFFAELKTEKGRVSAAQWQWIDALRSNDVTVYVWRPHDMDEILATLQGREGKSI